jgi:hypothetical protein
MDILVMPGTTSFGLSAYGGVGLYCWVRVYVRNLTWPSYTQDPKSEHWELRLGK